MDNKKINSKLFLWYSILWTLLIVALYQAYAVYFIDTASTKSKWVGLFAGAVFILLGFCKICEISYYKYKDTLIEKITKYFRKGLSIFYNSSLKYILFLAIIIGIILYKYLKYKFIICYGTGVITAVISIYSLNIVTTLANSKITYATNTAFKNSRKLAYSSGVAISSITIGIALSILVILFHIFKDYQIINGFCCGFCIVTFFNTISSVISKKAVSSADFVISSIEENLEENDKRNPLLLSKGITKCNLPINYNCINHTCSFIAVIIASMTIGGYCMQLMGAFLPIIIAASGVFASIIVILMSKNRENSNPISLFFIQNIVATIFLGIISNYTISSWLPNAKRLIYSIILGSITGLIICFMNYSSISKKYKPAKNIANSSTNGKTSLIFQLLKESSKNIFIPILLIAAFISSSFIIGYGLEAPTFGIYSIALSSVSFISTIGIIISLNTFATSSINSNEINMNYEENISNITNANLIGELNHNLLALGKNYICCASIISAINIFIGYTILVELEEIDILNPYVLSSLIIGSMISFVFCSIVIGGANKSGLKLVIESKKQFRHYPQIIEYQMRPNYEKVTKILANWSSIQAIVSIVAIILICYLIGRYLLQEALGGFIIGAILGSIGLLFIANNSSSLIVAAKKYFANEYQNAPYTNEYGIISDTDVIFNSLNDVISPCISSLINFIAILALTVAQIYL